ncbi:hypothetical protein B566_EDAN004307, partial [Ephemera danica]
MHYKLELKLLWQEAFGYLVYWVACYTTLLATLSSAARLSNSANGAGKLTPPLGSTTAPGSGKLRPRPNPSSSEELSSLPLKCRDRNRIPSTSGTCCGAGTVGSSSEASNSSPSRLSSSCDGIIPKAGTVHSPPLSSEGGKSPAGKSEDKSSSSPIMLCPAAAPRDRLSKAIVSGVSSGIKSASWESVITPGKST